MLTEKTFTQWLADAPNVPTDVARALYRREMEAARDYPTHMPACPAWCIEAAGHPFTDWENVGEGSSFTRSHYAFRGDGVYVSAFERYSAQTGPVFIELGCFVDERTLTSPDAARAHAVEVARAAEVLSQVQPSR